MLPQSNIDKLKISIRPWIVLAVGLAVFAPSAAAEPFCGPYRVVTGFLMQQYQERLAWRGKTPEPHASLEIWLSNRRKTWSLITRLSPPGQLATACLVASGHGWGGIGERV